MINKQKSKVSHRAIVLATVFACLSSAVNAADSAAPAATAPAEPPPPKWDTTAAAAVTLTRGNSETFMATLSLDTKRKW